jgi:thiol-disulfide isomerase/thioredoxin
LSAVFLTAARLRQRGGMVVEVWATWCPPCRTSIPHITQLQHKHPAIAFVGVTNEAKNVALPFVDKMGAQMDYRVALDTRGATNAYMEHFHLQGIPAAFVISKSGLLVWGGHPMDAGFEAALRQVDAEVAPGPAIDLRKETSESLGARPVKELKEIAKSAGVSLAGCVEKSEIVDKLLTH